MVLFHIAYTILLNIRLRYSEGSTCLKSDRITNRLPPPHTPFHSTEVFMQEKGQPYTRDVTVRHSSSFSSHAFHTALKNILPLFSQEQGALPGGVQHAGGGRAGSWRPSWAIHWDPSQRKNRSVLGSSVTRRNYESIMLILKKKATWLERQLYSCILENLNC